MINQIKRWQRRESNVHSVGGDSEALDRLWDALEDNLDDEILVRCAEEEDGLRPGHWRMYKNRVLFSPELFALVEEYDGTND